jgi:hypothetical protein
MKTQKKVAFGKHSQKKSLNLGLEVFNTLFGEEHNEEYLGGQKVVGRTNHRFLRLAQ